MMAIAVLTIKLKTKRTRIVRQKILYLCLRHFQNIS